MFLKKNKKPILYLGKSCSINKANHKSLSKKFRIITALEEINLKQYMLPTTKIYFVLANENELLKSFEVIENLSTSYSTQFSKLEIVAIFDQPFQSSEFAKYKNSLNIREQSINDLCAQYLIERFPLNYYQNAFQEEQIHVVIAGFNYLSISLISFILKHCHYNTERLSLTLIGNKPIQIENDLFIQYPMLETIAKVNVRSLNDLSWISGSFVTGIYVCLDSDEEGIDFATQIIEKLDQRQISPPIFLYQEVIYEESDIRKWEGQIYPFSYVEDLHKLLLYEDQYDDLAQIIHEYYLDTIAAIDSFSDDRNSLNSWDNLDEHFRSANRNQAWHMLFKLESINCSICPIAESDFFSFKIGEVEKLAHLEHYRWSIEKYLDSWHYHEQRNDQLKHHPYLVPYTKLPEPIKDINRYSIRLIPTLLTRNQLGIKRKLFISLFYNAPPTVTQKLKRQLTKTIKQICNHFPTYKLVIVARFISSIEKTFIVNASKYSTIEYELAICEKLTTIIKNFQSAQVKRDYLEQLYQSTIQLQFKDFEEWKHWSIERSDILICLDKDIKPSELKVRRLIHIDNNEQLRWNFEF